MDRGLHIAYQRDMRRLADEKQDAIIGYKKQVKRLQERIVVLENRINELERVHTGQELLEVIK